MKKVSEIWKSGRNGKIGVVAGIIVLLCVCCSLVLGIGSSANKSAQSSPDQTNPPIIDVEAIQTEVVLTVAASVKQTELANLPTDTPKPTNTKAPTKTPEPTSTPFQPVTYSGNGDDVIDIIKPDEPMLLKISYSGPGNFIIKNYSASNETIDLLVNTIGSYSGTMPIDMFKNQHTASLEIKASGPWTIEMNSLFSMRVETGPIITGTGSDIFLLAANADKLTIDASQASNNFIIYAYGDRADLIVNEIAPYTGTVMAPTGTIIQVIATGPWSIEIK